MASTMQVFMVSKVDFRTDHLGSYRRDGNLTVKSSKLNEMDPNVENHWAPKNMSYLSRSNNNTSAS